jgi:hypothetical protein
MLAAKQNPLKGETDMHAGAMPRWAAMVAGLSLSFCAHGQTMYRCGNAYQDHPCESSTNQKVLGSPSAARTAPAGAQSPDAGAGVSQTDTHCQQRGIQAEKIMWAREGGATLAQQIADSSHPVNAALASDVYQRRGSAADVRRAVEADCGTEAARAMEAARLNAAASAIMGGQSGQNLDTTPKPAEGGQATVSSSPQRAVSAQAQRCNDLQAEAKTIASQQHSGGSLATMRSLDDRANQNSQARLAAGC